MPARSLNLDPLPDNTQESFRELTHLFRRVAGDNLLAVQAFGSWLVNDPFYRDAPARSVVVLRTYELRMLDDVARQGLHFGRRGLQAPLIMTPTYLAESADVFPLELLEIQQINVLVYGVDAFAAQPLRRTDVRLQCERELKSTKIQLRQGLLSVAGQHAQLLEVCRAGADRAARVLRGLLHLAGRPAPHLSLALAAAARETTGLRLEGLGQVLSGIAAMNLAHFEHFYADLRSLADYVNHLPAAE